MITRTSRRYLAGVNSEPVSAVTGRARRARRPDKRPAQSAGAGRTRRRPARGEVEPMPGRCEQTRGTRVSSGTEATHGTRAAHGKRVDPALEVASGRAGPSYPRDGQPSRTGRGATGGQTRGAGHGAVRGLAMAHYLQRGVGHAPLPTPGLGAAGAAGTPHCGVTPGRREVHGGRAAHQWQR